MRKIISKEQEDKKRKKNQLLVGGVLILIMFLSVLGYSIGNNKENENEKIKYNGFEFTEQGDFWILNMGNFQFSFMYNPNEVESIKTTLNPINNYADQPLYIYSENIEAETEVYKNLVYYNSIAERIQKACPENEECAEGLPVKNCDNNFIIIKESNNSAVRQEDNCVFIDGKKEDLTKLTDSFLFKLIGVQ